MSKRARTSKNKIPKVSSFINQPTTKFRQSSPVNLQSFERHLDKLHLIGNQSKGGPLLVPIQNYDQKSASPNTTIESLGTTFKPIKEEEEEDEEILKKNNAKIEYKSDEDDVFGQFLAIDRGGKRKKKYKSYKIKKKTTKRIRKTRRKTRKRTRRKTKRKMMGKK